MRRKQDICCLVCRQVASSSQKRLYVAIFQGKQSATLKGRLERTLCTTLQQEAAPARHLCPLCGNKLTKIEELLRIHDEFRALYEESVNHWRKELRQHDTTPDSAEQLKEGEENLKEANEDEDGQEVERASQKEGENNTPDVSLAPVINKKNFNPCEVCGTIFSTSVGLKVHMKTHLEKIQQTLSVAIVGDSDNISNRHQLEEHTGRRDGMSQFKCNICPFTGGSSAEIDSHLQEQHPDNARDEHQEKKKKEKITIESNLSSQSESNNPRRVSKRILKKRALSKAEYSKMVSNIVTLKHKRKKLPTVSWDEEIKELNQKLNLLDENPENLTDPDLLRLYRCSRCDDNLDSREEWLNHCNQVHSFPAVGCDECYMICTSKGNLSQHKEKSHNTATVKGKSNVNELQKDPKAGCIEEDMVTKPNSLYNCNTCGKEFKCQNSLASHIYHKHSKENAGTPPQFSCAFCTRKFLHAPDKEEHEIAHRNGKVLTCHVCNSGFQKQASLAVHMLTHTGEYPHVCDICSKGFAHAWALKNHKTKHTGEKPFKCSFCDATFGTTEQRYKHIRRQHSDKRSHSCQYCSKQFTSLKFLEAHLRRVHYNEAERRWVCDLCETNFGKFQEYKAHFKEIHVEQKKVFTCQTCDKVFKRKIHFEAHLEVHVKEKTVECPLCQKLFKGKCQLASHMYTSHSQVSHQHSKGQKLLCETCGKSYKNPKGLRMHMRTHTGEGMLKCEVCGIMKPNPSRLRVHMATMHATEKPYKCNICSKEFVYAISYRAHCNMHGDVRPFLCSVCGKGFRTGYHMKEHMNVHNQIKSFFCEECNQGFLWRAQLLKHKKLYHTDPLNPPPPPVKRTQRKTAKIDAKKLPRKENQNDVVIQMPSTSVTSTDIFSQPSVLQHPLQKVNFISLPEDGGLDDRLHREGVQLEEIQSQTQSIHVDPIRNEIPEASEIQGPHTSLQSTVSGQSLSCIPPGGQQLHTQYLFSPASVSESILSHVPVSELSGTYPSAGGSTPAISSLPKSSMQEDPKVSQSIMADNAVRILAETVVAMEGEHNVGNLLRDGLPIGNRPTQVEVSSTPVSTINSFVTKGESYGGGGGRSLTPSVHTGMSVQTSVGSTLTGFQMLNALGGALTSTMFSTASTREQTPSGLPTGLVIPSTVSTLGHRQPMPGPVVQGTRYLLQTSTLPATPGLVGLQGSIGAGPLAPQEDYMFSLRPRTFTTCPRQMGILEHTLSLGPQTANVSNTATTPNPIPVMLSSGTPSANLSEVPGFISVPQGSQETTTVGSGASNILGFIPKVTQRNESVSTNNTGHQEIPFGDSGTCFTNEGDRTGAVQKEQHVPSNSEETTPTEPMAETSMATQQIQEEYQKFII